MRKWLNLPPRVLGVYAPFRQILNAIPSKAGILKAPFSFKLILTHFLLSN